MKYELTDVLKQGSDNAMRTDELCALLGIDTRTLTKEVQNARMRGIPICSNMKGNTGYFLGNDEEVKRCCRQLEHRALTALKTRKALRYSLVPDRQISMFDE